MSIDPKSTYYDAGGIETIEIVKAKLTPEQYAGYLLGTLLVYACRLNFKGATAEEQARDAEKAAIYATWLADWRREQAILRTDAHGLVNPLDLARCRKM